MVALVKLIPESRQLSYLRFSPVDGVKTKITPNKMGVQLSNPRAVYASGKQEGELVEEGNLKANQVARLEFGVVSPNQYELLVSPNPALCSQAIVSSPSILSVGNRYELSILISAFKSINLAEFEHILTLYLID